MPGSRHGFKLSVTAAERRQLDIRSDLRNLEQYTKVRSVQDIQPNDRHIVNAVDFLFNYAFDQRASDIHIEPKRDQSLIRLHIDGVLNEIHRMPRVVHPAFVSRIKTLARLTDMGVQPYLIESTLIGVIAQRLVRKICQRCQASYTPGPEVWAALGSKAKSAVEFKRGKGCVHCRNTGYFGRMGVYEIMRVDETIRALIHRQGGTSDIQRAAHKAGMKTLRESALQKLLAGLTTVEEVVRVTSMY